MTFEVELTPAADADLDRLFDFLLERAETVEEALRAYEAIAVIRAVADTAIFRPRPTATAKWVNARHCASSSSHSAPRGTSFVSTYALRAWSSSSARAASAKRTTTEAQSRLFLSSSPHSC